jgi:hypothetical protein
MICDAAAVCCYPVASSSKYYIACLISHHPDWQGINTLHTLSPPLQGLAQEQAVKRKLNFKQSHFNCRSSVKSKANLVMEKICAISQA